MCSLIKTFIGNWVILESVSLDFVGSSLWGTKTFPHYLVVENHLDLKDGSLEWPLCFFVYQGGVKKKRISPEMWGFFLEQLITEIYPHQLECKSTVNTPRPRQRPPPPPPPSSRGTSLFGLNL